MTDRNKRRSFNDMLNQDEEEPMAAPVGTAAPPTPPRPAPPAGTPPRPVPPGSPPTPPAAAAYPPMQPPAAAPAYPPMPPEEENLRPGLERKASKSEKRPPSGKHIALNPINKKKSGSPLAPVLVTVVLLLAGALAFWLGAQSNSGSDLPSAGLPEGTTVPEESSSPDASVSLVIGGDTPDATPSSDPTSAVGYTLATRPTPTPSAAAVVPATPDATPSAAAATPAATPSGAAATPAVKPTPAATSAQPSPAATAAIPTPSVKPTTAAAKPTPAVTPTTTAAKPTPAVKPTATAAKPTPAVKPTTTAAKPTPAVKPTPATVAASGAFTVNVKSNVKDSKILLYRGKERFSGSGSVKPTAGGTYTLKVTAPGYKPYVKQMKVTGSHNLQVYLEAEPQPVYEPSQPAYDPGPSYYDPGPAYYPSGGGGGGGYEIPSGGL